MPNRSLSVLLSILAVRASGLTGLKIISDHGGQCDMARRGGKSPAWGGREFNPSRRRMGFVSYKDQNLNAYDKAGGSANSNVLSLVINTGH